MVSGKVRPWVPRVSVLVVVALVAALVAWSRGITDRVLDLNNSGVWVTNDSRALFGRINRSAGALDCALADARRDPGAVQLDIFQDGEAVVAWTRSQSRLFAVDTAAAVGDSDRSVAVSAASAVAMGGGVIAVISDTGEIRTARYSPAESVTDLSGLGTGSAPVAKVDVLDGRNAGVDVAVDSQGRVFAASTSGQTVMIAPSGQPETGKMAASLQSVAVTVVNGTGVVADPEAGKVYVSGQPVDVGPGVVPQQPSVMGDKVFLATQTALFELPLVEPKPSQVYSIPQDPGGGTPVDPHKPDASAPVRVPARPVVSGDVVHGAWGGTPGRVVRLNNNQPTASVFPADSTKLYSPVFRVNRGTVLLNDMYNGGVFDVEELRPVADWEAIVPPKSDDSPRTSPVERTQDLRVQPDHLWVRPGRDSVLHVLDNDENPGSGIIAITGVAGPDAHSVTVSPDGQTLVVAVPPGQKSDMIVTYTATNQAADQTTTLQGSAQVTISMRAPAENTLPVKSGKLGGDAEKPDYTVASGGTLPIAPAYVWRDDDSDPVHLVSASVGDRVLPVTAGGLVEYSAPITPDGLVEKIDYLVTDGSGKTAPGSVFVRALGQSASAGVAPQAMPDAVRGVAGHPIVFHPLDNDIPGCDPMRRDARLALASPVGDRPGIHVVPGDISTGAVTVLAADPGVYFLDYTASYGSQIGLGKIRVDAVAADPLVAMPDAAVLRGTVPALVDVLANDHDGLGSVLTVVSAAPRDPDRVQVGVVAGRWLRVTMTSSAVDAAPVVVDYAVTNGAGETAAGELTITQEPALDNDLVSVVDDYAKVRVGDVTSIPVLANDFAASGTPLVIRDNTPGMTAGQLLVENPSAPADQAEADVGQAYVDGTRVRYVAPTTGDQPRQVRITYQASVPTGSPVTGHVYVTVVPEQLAGNQVPVPAPVDVRVMVGETKDIQVDPFGQDPDGDSVVVAGLASPPLYGRVVSFTANSLTYESYPEDVDAGTDQFQYFVQDRYGAVGLGTVRIGRSAPGTPPPPVAVDDVVTAQPGSLVTVYPRVNDLIPVGTPKIVSVVQDGDAPGVTFDPANTIATVAPGMDDPPVTAAYHLDAGGVAGLPAQVTVRSAVGYFNPPHVEDQVADDVQNGVASVNALRFAWDVDGPDSGIRIVSVGAGATFEGSLVSVPVADRGQVVPFVAQDEDGAQSLGVVFVPGSNAGRPALVDGGVIGLDRNGSKTIALDDYIKSPRDKPVFITAADRVWASPEAGLNAAAVSGNQVKLTALNDYVGPAALTVEVRDSPSPDDPGALTGVVTIPVQVGPNQPVLWCPSDVVRLSAGGDARQLDITQYCHVWMPQPHQPLVYNAAWASGGDELVVAGPDGGGLPSNTISLRAGPRAVPGAESELTVTVEGYPGVSGRIKVLVTGVPKPVLQVSSVSEVRQGTTVTVPVTVRSAMAGAVQHVVSVRQTSGPAGAVTFDDHSIRVTPGGNVQGVLAFDVVASDVTDDNRVDRQVRGSFSVTVYGVPDPPSPPQPETTTRYTTVMVKFTPGADNGSPVTQYEVRWPGGSQSCGLNTTCEINGLAAGQSYAFQARATNKAGSSDWSAAGPPVTPDARPGRVVGLKDDSLVHNPCYREGLTVSWDGVEPGSPPATKYRVDWNGDGDSDTEDAPDRQIKIYPYGGSYFGALYTFTIVAGNEAGWGPPVTYELMPACNARWDTTTDEVRAASVNSRDGKPQVLVRWDPVHPVGPGPVTYKVTRSRGTETPVTLGTVTFGVDQPGSFTDGKVPAYDGAVYTYTVWGENATAAAWTGPGNYWSESPLKTDWTAIAPPKAWNDPGNVTVRATGNNNELEFSVVNWPEPPAGGTPVPVVVTLGQTEVVTLTKAEPTRTVANAAWFPNGSQVKVTFTAKNSSASNQAQTVTYPDGPYGPLEAPSVIPIPGEGKYACVQATTPASGTNGRPAMLEVATGGRIVWDSEYTNTPIDSGATGAPRSGKQACVDTGGYGRTVGFTVSLLSGKTGGERRATATADMVMSSSPPPPEPLNDECGDTLATACTWANLDEQLIVRLESPGDQDWYKITPAKTGTWTFESSYAFEGFTDPVVDFSMVDGVYAQSAYDRGSGGNGQFMLTVNMGAGFTYLLRIRAGTEQNTGAFGVTATPQPDNNFTMTVAKDYSRDTGKCDGSSATVCYNVQFTFHNLTSNVTCDFSVGGLPPDEYTYDADGTYDSIDRPVMAGGPKTYGTGDWTITCNNQTQAPVTLTGTFDR